MSISDFETRNYRLKFNLNRFAGWLLKHRETDIWIGVDKDSYQKEMEDVALTEVLELRQKLDGWITREPQFIKNLKPFKPAAEAPLEAKKMAKAAARAGMGPMASVAGLFSRQVGKSLIQNFSVKELVIENGGDIFALVEQKLLLTVFAGSSPLSEKIGIVIPSGSEEVGICTSSGTIGPSLSFGKADAVAVVCKNVLLADALATAIGNEVKHPDNIEKALEFAEKFPEILSVIIICNDKVGIRGTYEIKLLN